MASERRIVIFGAGGHGKVVADVAASCGWTVLGMVDDRVRPCGLSEGSYTILGGRDWLLEQPRDSFACALGIGDNADRASVAEFLDGAGFELVPLVSAFAVISTSAQIGRGSVVMPGAVVNASAVLEDGVVVNTCAVVEHDCRVGRFSHIAPNSTLGGGGKVGEFTLIGVGATVKPWLSVGCRSILGAGAVVTISIPDDVVAYGIPARVQRILEKD